MQKTIDINRLFTQRWYTKEILKVLQSDLTDGMMLAKITSLVNEQLVDVTELIEGEAPEAKPEPANPAMPSPARKISLGIVVGHTKAAQGAVMAAPYKVSEYVYNSEIAKLVQKYAPSGMEVDILYRDKGGISGAYAEARAEKCDCVIELHFNAANGKAFGTETLVSSESVDKQFGQIIQDALEPVFGRVNNGKGDRGLIVDPSRGGASVRAFKGAANCLTEAFFGDNPSEAKMAMERKDEYAKAIISGVLEWAALTGKVAA